jgi:hypothetical protein
MCEAMTRMRLAYPFPCGTPPLGYLCELTMEELGRRPVAALRDFAIAADLEAYRVLGALTIITSDIDYYESWLTKVLHRGDVRQCELVMELLDRRRADVADYEARQQRIQQHQNRLRTLLDARLPPETRGSVRGGWDRPQPN